MRLISIWNLFSTSKLSVKNKKHIAIASIVLCLEYLDLIVYLHNANELTKTYCSSRIIGIVVLFCILWLSNFSAKYLIGKKVINIYQKFNAAKITTISCLVIAAMLFFQGLTIIFYCNTKVIQVLFLLLIFRFIYQVAIGIIIHETYGSLLNLHDIDYEFTLLIVNSLELSLVIGIIGYKFIPYLHVTSAISLSVFIFTIAIAWIVTSAIFYSHRSIINSFSKLINHNTAANNFTLMFKHHHKDTIISIGIVGIRSSLCIIGVIYLPQYLVSSLHISAHATTMIIMTSSIISLVLCLWVNKHLNKFDYINLMRYGLVSLIIGSIISYILFFFKVIPAIGVLILILFHSLFALSCPFILSNLFNPAIRQLAIISCYRNSFLIFASITFLIIDASSQIITSGFLPPALFLIFITITCYVCLVLFNTQNQNNTLKSYN